MATQGDDFSVYDAGPLTGWAGPSFTIPGTTITAAGKQFLQEKLALSGAEVSLNVFRPGQSMGMSHKHRRNEELYLFLSGRGEMLLDGRVVPVREGTCVRVSPKVARDWRNTGDADLAFVVIQYLAGSAVGPTAADGLPATDPAGWPT